LALKEMERGMMIRSNGFTTVPMSYEKKMNENMQLLSPNVAMDRRRSSSKPWRANAAQPCIMSRSLVGNHVRFPSQWDTLLSPTSPPIHRLNHSWSKWFYVARHATESRATNA